MKKNQIKTSIIPLPRTRAEVETLVNQIAQAENDKRAANAGRDEAILRANTFYSGVIARFDDYLAPRLQAVKAWAEANPGEFARRKSIDFTTATIGFRTGMPRLKLVKTTWGRVLGAIRQGPWRKYVRVSEEVNRELILADHKEKVIAAAELKTLGLEVAQEETFYFDSKLSETTRRQTAILPAETRAAA